MKKKILVVDNHPVMLKFMANLLEKKGHEVKTSKDGLSALDILNNYIPDIMFVDLVMPNIDGPRLCKIIRGTQKLNNVYIIILSGIAAEEETDFTDFGANACIAKGPFNEMAKHVLAVLDQSDAESSKSFSKEIEGVQHIYQREITKELLSSKRHSEVILQNMSEGILELTIEGRIIYANLSATSLIDTPEEKLLASNFIELFHGNDRERIKKMVTKSGVRPAVITMDLPVKLNNKLISLNLLPVKEEKNKSIIVIFKDITERKRLEEESMKTKKLESFGIIARGIAHDFNNLLTAILGNINLAQMKIQSEDSIYTILNDAEKASLQAKDLTEKFLTFSTGSITDKKPSSIKELLEDSVAQTLTSSNVEWKYSIPDDLWKVKVDTEQMKQAIINVIINAKEAMPEGGLIEVTAEKTTVDSDKKEAGISLKNGKYIKVCIRDQGMGIPEENIQKIFDPYFSTKDRCTQKGLGLGLVITHSIIKKHDGYIHVESKVGTGTDFYLYIPAV